MHVVHWSVHLKFADVGCRKMIKQGITHCSFCLIYRFQVTHQFWNAGKNTSKASSPSSPHHHVPHCDATGEDSSSFFFSVLHFNTFHGFLTPHFPGQDRGKTDEGVFFSIRGDFRGFPGVKPSDHIFDISLSVHLPMWFEILLSFLVIVSSHITYCQRYPGIHSLVMFNQSVNILLYIW